MPGWSAAAGPVPFAGGLEAVYLQHRAALVRFPRARGAGARAEDLVQELWLRISGVRTGPVADPLSYLYRSANNLMLNAHRADTRASARNEEWTDAQGPRHSDGIEREIVARHEIARAKERLARAGERVQEVFFLFRVEGLSQRQIAERFGLSLSAIEKDIQRAYRAIAALRDEDDEA